MMSGKSAIETKSGLGTRSLLSVVVVGSIRAHNGGGG